MSSKREKLDPAAGRSVWLKLPTKPVLTAGLRLYPCGAACPEHGLEIGLCRVFVAVSSQTTRRGAPGAAHPAGQLLPRPHGPAPALRSSPPPPRQAAPASAAALPSGSIHGTSSGGFPNSSGDSHPTAAAGLPGWGSAACPLRGSGPGMCPAGFLGRCSSPPHTQLELGSTGELPKMQ